MNNMNISELSRVYKVTFANGDTHYGRVVSSKKYSASTYLKDMDDRAAARYHSTTTQAATIAKKAGVKQLLIGHFSSKYDKLDQFEIEAKEIFPNTQLAIEGATYKA